VKRREKWRNGNGYIDAYASAIDGWITVNAYDDGRARRTRTAVNRNIWEGIKEERIIFTERRNLIMRRYTVG